MAALKTILQRTTSQTLTDNVETTISWDTTVVRDDVSAFSSGTPTQVTVPSGATLCRVVTYAIFGNTTTNITYLRLYKNGSLIQRSDRNNSTVNENGMTLTTGWFTVAAGDTLLLKVLADLSAGSPSFSPTAGFGAPANIQFEWK